MTTELRGVLGPVVSTFDPASGELDPAAFRANVGAHLAAGLHGIVVCGSTGEAVLLDESERERLVVGARETVPSDRLLIVGAGAESTRTTLARARHAAAAGADAVLVIPPHYYRSAMTDEVVLAYFQHVAGDSPVPVVLYNIPKYVGFAIAPAVVEELAGHPNVIGIKDSSGDRDLMAEYVKAQREDFSVLTGSGTLFGAALGAGARGAILAVALFAPELSLRVYDAVRQGDTAAAAAAQRQLAPVASTIVGSLGVAGVKAALDLVGLRGGPVRSPLLPLGEQELAQVRTLVGVGATAAGR